ncbi:MAG: hydrogen peroxide-inducible genes activator [Alphaproteobacteria bacterium]|nr:hydrogen peroxide-inducible genes activator [Alphaproteobacteria bacterium]HPF46318.1 hydrogen peroxide-inducible genes activator [Emcibacteraceae bacterium]HRW30540.1 hydrogen peroxide-inducible genes activator [Emcibacteraceae bacterium]
MKFLPSLKQLEYLTALVQTRHFSQASDLCNVTPSTLSAGIRDLEDVLGVSVAERTKRTVIITPIGLEIATRARQLLRDAEDIMVLASSERDPMTGNIKFGVIPTIGPFMLPKILTAIENDYPKLKLYLREEQTAILLNRLSEGELDIILIALPYETGNFVVSELFNDEFYFACHSDHPYATRKSIALDDLNDQPLLLLEDGHCLRDHALDACRIQNSATRVQFEATSLNTLIQMVAEGIGVTLIPEMAADTLTVPMGKIKLIPLKTPASRKIGLVWRASSPRAAEFKILAEALKNLWAT